MITLREAAQQALEALVLWATGRDIDAVALNDLIFRLEAALAEPQIDPVDEYRKGFIAGQIDMRDREPAEPVQEPYCCVYEYDSPYGLHREFYPREYNGMKPTRTVPVYTAPPQRKPLTEEELTGLMAQTWGDASIAPQSASAFARAIERAHGIGGSDE